MMGDNEFEIFVRMCDKAEEIQRHRFNENGILIYWEDGDLFCSNINYGSWVVCTEYGMWPLNRNQGYIWLPRQGELQVLSGLLWRAFDMLCLEMASKGGSAEYMETKQQVGIMAVMKLNHNKVWNGEDWIEIGGD